MAIRYPVVPTNITVHLGNPNENAKDINKKLQAENKKELAEDLIKELERQGYKVTKGKVESAPKTMIINRKGMTEEQTKRISNIVLNNTIQTGEDNSEFNYTIIIGKDYTKI